MHTSLLRACPAVRSWAFALLPGALFAQQTPPPRVAADPLAAITAAERALAADDRELALLLLWGADAALQQAPAGAATTAAVDTIAALLAEADPAIDERCSANAAVSRKLVALARAYRGRKWNSVARSTAELAATFDRDTAARELDQLGGAKAPTPDRPDRDDIDTLRCLEQSGGWHCADASLSSPDPLPPTSAIYLTRLRHEDQRIAVTVDVGDRAAMIGILVGAADGSQYYICDNELYGGKGEVQSRLYRWSDGMLEELGEGSTDPGRARTGPTRFEILVRGDEIEAVVDGASCYRLRCPTQVRGHVGFYVSGASPYKGSVTFRDLEVAALPENAPTRLEREATAQRERERAVTAAITAAERLLQQRRPEQAALQLGAGRALARQLPGTLLQRSLLDAIESLLRRADPLHGRREQVLVEAAASLRPLAERYVAAAMPEAAALIAARMAELDPDGQTAAAEEFARGAALARSQRAAEELRKRADLAIDNKPLRQWLEGGPQPFHSSGRIWQFGSDGALSPPLQQSEAWLIANRDADITGVRVQFQLPADTTVGLVFGWRDEATFAIAETSWSGGKLRVRLRWRHQATWVELGSGSFDVAPDAREWIELGLSWSAAAIVTRCNDRELKLPNPAELRGRIGLMAGARGSAPVQLQFRGFMADVPAAAPATVPAAGK